MTSTDCRGEWLTSIAMREWRAGFVDGFALGFMFVALVCAVIVWKALDEAWVE